MYKSLRVAVVDFTSLWVHFDMKDNYAASNLEHERLLHSSTSNICSLAVVYLG